MTINEHITPVLQQKRVEHPTLLVYAETDLSLAIAHGLEDTCIVKPKEKPERTKK